MVRASIKAERAGVPTASLVCGGFAQQASATAAGLGLRDLPLSVIPGHVNVQTKEELQSHVEQTLVDQIIRGLTVQPGEVAAVAEPDPRDIVFQGTFDEVNDFFYANEWSDGLPIVPPTLSRVEQFLKYTDVPAEQVIGTLLPDKREATAWNIAVNGVMAGCRPEYMPVLIAIIRAMADPKFGQEHLGHTPGAEVLITINGPIIKDLDFNFEQGALRVGYQANTTIGRFWRLYLRNVAGFLPHKTDKATFGGTWRVVLAENEDALAKIGWPPLSVDQGFQAGENVVTIGSCLSTDSLMSVGSPSAEVILDRLAGRIAELQLWVWNISRRGLCVRPQVLISPMIAEAIAKGGYSKQGMREYLHEHARFKAKRYGTQPPYSADTLCDAVARGELPKIYGESENPERMVPIVFSPDDFMIVVSGDPTRDNCLVGAQNGHIGYPVSKRIDLPKNWKELLSASRRAGTKARREDERRK